MKAVRMYAPRDLRVEEVDIPSYEADECLIKVMAVGVCGSDIPRVNSTWSSCFSNYCRT